MQDYLESILPKNDDVGAKATLPYFTVGGVEDLKVACCPCFDGRATQGNQRLQP